MQKRKMSKKQRRELVQLKRVPVVISNETVAYPNVTSPYDDMDTSLRANAVQANLLVAFPADVTIAPPIEEADDKEEEDEETSRSLSKNWVQLLEKIASDKLKLSPRLITKIIFLGWIGTVAAAFVYDNSANKIDNMDGLMWFSIKTLYLSVFCMLIIAVMGVACFGSTILTNMQRSSNSKSN